MKRSISDESLSSAKTAKQVHHRPDNHPPARRNKPYLDEAWKMLQPAINIIFQDAYSPDAFNCNLILRAVVRLCRTDSDALFHMIKDECEPHVAKAIHSLETQISEPSSVFLPLVEKCWLDFKRRIIFVSDIAMYRTCNGCTLWDMGEGLFQEKLSLVSQLQDKVIAGILGLVTDQRLGETDINVTLLKNLMDMFRGMWDVFRKPFLDSISDFYAAKAVQVLQQSDISHYLKFVERSLSEEKNKYKENYLFFSACWSPLMEVVPRQLLEVQSSVLEQGFTVLMDEGHMDDLRRMYGLFYGANLVGYINRFLRSYIRDKGAMEGCSLQELHTSIDKIWHRCFSQDASLDDSIRECFKDLGLHIPDEYSDELCDFFR